MSFCFFRWYQIKITIRWEDSEYTSLGTPARVVQYEGTLLEFLVAVFLFLFIFYNFIILNFIFIYVEFLVAVLFFYYHVSGFYHPFLFRLCVF